jgi:opacity protein-like surface antigen
LWIVVPARSLSEEIPIHTLEQPLATSSAIADGSVISAIGDLPATTLRERPTQRRERWYAGGSIGVTFPVNTTAESLGSSNTGIAFDTTVSTLGFIGYQTDNWRFEGEVRTLSPNTSMGGSLTQTSVTANLYRDFPTDSVYIPYVGLGVGMTNVTANRLHPASSTAVFAYQVKAGVSQSIDPRADLFLQYRYTGTTTIGELQGVKLGILESHNVEAGLRFGF